MGNIFNTGLIFYYWPYFNPEQVKDEKQSEIFYNVNDYSGIGKDKLFIGKPKYEHMKAEALSSGYCALKLFSEKVILKSLQYFSTSAVKEMKAKYFIRDQAAHYGIDGGIGISLKHLQSVIIYT
eukprot:173622_1